MTTRSPRSEAGIVFVERIDGADADPAAPPALLVEVPHGADERAHYDALRSRMRGALPDDLHIFFHVNTDIGAWQVGRRTAERVVAARPDRSALLLRCLVPRTFVDTNRLEDAGQELVKAGLTAGVAPYVTDPDDVALLLELHRRYVRAAEEAYAWVCDAGGFALSPHTYGPRTMGIGAIDAGIVDALRRAHEPEPWASWPVRPEIDFISRTAEGERLGPSALIDDLLARYRALGAEVVEGKTYTLHPGTQTMRWVTRYPEQVFCLELRRDLLVESYTPFTDMRVVPERADLYAAPLAAALDTWLTARAR